MRLLRRHRQLERSGSIHLRRDADLVGILHLIFNREGPTLLGLGRHNQLLTVLTMTHRNRRVRNQGDLLLESLLVLGQGRLFLIVLFVLVLRILRVLVRTRRILLRCPVEPFVGLLQERDMRIQFLHVERTVQTELTVIRDIVTQ